MPGIVTAKDGDGAVRVIRKPDGSVVKLHPDGVAIIEKSDGGRVTHWPDGTCLVENATGERTWKRRRLARAGRPLNVSSNSDEEIGRLMSNFAWTPFELDGRRYSSVESFYVCLKFPHDKKLQNDIRKMEGKDARRLDQNSTISETVYGGRTFALGSPEHHELIKRAIRAKLEQNPEIARAFAATHPRPIVHDTGHEQRAGTKLPAPVFIRILTELRAETIERLQAANLAEKRKDRR